jgi:hypothetical protein
MLRQRAQAMVERVALEAGYHLGAEAAWPVRAALTAALAHRDGAVEDDHDPRLLHPARTVLILLSDGGCRDPELLAAGAFAESLDQELRAPLALLEEAAGAAARGHAAALPRPDLAEPGLLLEALVTAEEGPALLAVAELLDHARHLHLRPELDWRAVHGLVGSAGVPAARRLNAPLARRLERWHEAFARRRLERVPPGV